MKSSLITSLQSFLKESPTPFHACENLCQKFTKAGFIELKENENWHLKPHGQYFVTRNHSAVIAFRLGENIDDAMTMIGAHTDSPCLKPKPNAISQSHGYTQCQVHVYGGALLNPWFDRDLSLAGKVVFQDKNQNMHSTLIDFKKPIATIPSLAIHLDRSANSERHINAQLHLPPLLRPSPSAEELSMNDLLQAHIETRDELNNINVLNFDLSFYDHQAPQLIGLDESLLASARLDNLLSCFCASEAIINNNAHPALVVFTDHEEVGSQSQCGAQGSFLADVIERFHESHETKSQFIRNSMMYSVDNAHAIHPNYADKHDKYHAPVLGQGIVVKHNANQRYATNAESAAICQKICSEHSLAIQHMVVRNDMACGSTIGPIISSEIGISTVDIGIPQLAMHSIRELAHIDDIATMVDFLIQACAQSPFVKHHH